MESKADALEQSFEAFEDDGVAALKAELDQLKAKIASGVIQAQLHLAVRTKQGFVHAHAGIRRVVETPGEPQWPLLGAYRKRRR